MRPIADLSGGEKARVALSALAVRPTNVLLLDEPTNHLDAETVEVLARALAEYEGAIVLVSHDRYLVEQLATHVFHVRNGQVTAHEGLQASDLELQPEARQKSSSDTNTGAASHAARKQRKREAQRRVRRIAEIEKTIDTLDRQVTTLDQELCEVGADYEKANALGVKRAAAEAELEALYAEWEALEAASADEA